MRGASERTHFSGGPRGGDSHGVMADGKSTTTTSITTDDADRRTRIDLADGGRWEYTYDNAGQLTGGTRFGPKLDNTEGTLVQYAYQYDGVGQPRERSERDGRTSRSERAQRNRAAGERQLPRYSARKTTVCLHTRIII